MLNTGSISKWEKRLEIYMEDALVLMRPVQHQVLLKTLPGLAQSFGSIIDALSFPDAIATLCGDDVCLVICEDADAAQNCFEELKNSPLHFSLKNNKIPCLMRHGILLYSLLRWIFFFGSCQSQSTIWIETIK